MKLAKMLIALFSIPFAIIGAGQFIERWIFGPTTPREEAMCILAGITGITCSAITMAVVFTMGERTTPDTDQPPA